MGDGSRQLPQDADTRQMRQLLTVHGGVSLGRLAVGNIDRDAAQQDGFPMSIAFGHPAGGDPAYLMIRQHDTVLDVIFPGNQRAADRLRHHSSVVGMHGFGKTIEVDAAFVCHPV